VLIASAQLVRVQHDALDYVAALGGLAGALAAIVALIFAARSKTDAERSADASEEALSIMREEAAVAKSARERRASLRIQLRARAMETSDKDPPRKVVLTLWLGNWGTEVAKRPTAKLLLPDSLALETSGDEYGNSPGAGSIGRGSDKRLKWEHRLETLILRSETPFISESSLHRRASTSLRWALDMKTWAAHTGCLRPTH
jgi:hypothetical protein